jgi:hypothetical protein
LWVARITVTIGAVWTTLEGKNGESKPPRGRRPDVDGDGTEGIEGNTVHGDETEEMKEDL